MKKVVLIVIMLSLTTIVAYGDNYDDLEKLKQDKRKLAIEMHNKRVELIKKIPALKTLQKKIVALHRELAIRIDNNSEMRKLISKEREIKTKINIIENE